MKLTIRPFQRGKAVFVVSSGSYPALPLTYILFQVEAEPSETIHDLKLRISEQGFPVETQNLLSTGKSLQDDKTIGSYGIKEASSLVLMIKAGSAAVLPNPDINSSPSTAPDTLSAPPPPAQATSANHLSVPTQASVPPEVASSIPQAISGTAQGPSFNGAGIYSNAGPSQSNIETIPCTALRASLDNVDQAVELLINDPDNIGAAGAAQAANRSRFAYGASPQTSGLPQPQDLMKMVAQQQQQQAPSDLSSMSLGALGGLRGAGAGAGSGAPTAEVSPEQIEEIRRLVAYNPILTGPLLEQIKQDDPDLYNYIDNDPEKLLLALAQGGDNSGTSAPPAPASRQPPALARLPATPPVPQRMMQPTTQTQTVEVTQEERQAIETIIGMGFEKQQAIQAYLACDKSVERAVEFLVAGAF
ncbi:hypothetical protein EDB92DRAFT_2117701 [Lactarius akahatsu]|uniref:UV excision repair protein RAD23 n=1 Tax=Lactarius akahatsu TaxID=416441 RepID=A0AAD4LDC0_9AGAM|nr:hypothetical protein EDB92DRAFT_2117701 [Lactarius akahatsu]